MKPFCMFFFINISPLYKNISRSFNTKIKGIDRVSIKLIIYILFYDSLITF